MLAVKREFEFTLWCKMVGMGFFFWPPASGVTTKGSSSFDYG